MTSTLLKYVLTAILTVHLTAHMVFAEQTTSTTLKNQPNRFLNHLVKKYGSHGKISFEVIYWIIYIVYHAPMILSSIPKMICLRKNEMSLQRRFKSKVSESEIRLHELITSRLFF